MPELSNLLRQRLGAAEEGHRTHPDPDTLTAFTEQLLPAAERQQVLTHLAACGECREVLALSQPEALEPATQPVFAPAALPFWRRLFTPAFGLATAMAAIALAAVVVLQTPHRPAPQQSNQEAKASPLPAAPQPNSALPDQKTAEQRTADQSAAEQSAAEQHAAEQSAAALAKSAAPAAVDSYIGQQANLAVRGKTGNERPASGIVAELAMPTRNSLPAAKTAAARQPGSAAPAPVLSAGLRKKDFLNNAFFETNGADVVMAGQSNGNLPAAPQPQPSSTDAKFNASVPGQITIFSDIPPNTASNKSNMRILTPAPPPERFGCTVCKVVTAGARAAFHRTPATAPAISSSSLTFSAMGSGKFSSDLQKGQPAEVAAAPEKSEAGMLESTEGLRARSMSSGVASTQMPPSWKIIGGKLLKSAGTQWEDAYPAANFQFTFVNAHGSEVWAGGSHAALIHSRDNGATWETSRLGEAASGAIMSILFLGNNIQVKTSDDQSWSSSDNGKTWTQN
jgi:hypothetical protein